jgi:predicted Zn finger-like uncharacterized protein
MYTYCPGCTAIFRITAETVSAAQGRVRCGECGRVFNAVDCLYDDAVTARHAALMNAGQGLPVAATEQPSVAEETIDEIAAVDQVHRPLPQSGWAGKSVGKKELANGLLAGLLLLLLGLQWVYFNRDALAGDTSVRPTMEWFCSVLHCRLPLRVDLAQLEIIDRDVRKHPQVDAALLINASIVNRAGFRQPYPVFEITFSDVSGRPVSMRRFLPAEYLGEGSDTTTGMAPDVPVNIVLEVQDPGDAAVSFQFGFL